jgi:hypothetical protein
VARHSVSRKDFPDVWLRCNKKSQNEDVVGYAIEALHLESCMQDVAECVKRTIRVMSTKISQLWKNSSRHLDRFFRK